MKRSDSQTQGPISFIKESGNGVLGAETTLPERLLHPIEIAHGFIILCEHRDHVTRNSRKTYTEPDCCEYETS